MGEVRLNGLVRGKGKDVTPAIEPHEIGSGSIGNRVAYISFKISGDEENCAAVAQKIADEWMGWGYDVINPYKMYDQSRRNDWEYYLRNDLSVMLTKADVVVAAANWIESKGAVLEVFNAIITGIPVLVQTGSGYELLNLSPAIVMDMMSAHYFISDFKSPSRINIRRLI